MSTDAETLMRIGQLERLVDHLYRHLGLEPPAPSDGLSPQVRELALAGNLLEAIKLHRQQTGKDLATAKMEVESLA